MAGIDDLRAFSVRKREALPLYANEMTRDFLLQSYQYIFDPGVTAVPGTSKPRLEMHVVEPWRPFTVAGVEVLPLPFLHGPVDVLGFRIGRLAYITDVKAVPQDAREALTGLDVLVINALWWRQHPTHQSIPEAIEAAQAIGARRTYLTHLSHETGHAKLAESLRTASNRGTTDSRWRLPHEAALRTDGDRQARRPARLGPGPAPGAEPALCVGPGRGRAGGSRASMALWRLARKRT